MCSALGGDRLIVPDTRRCFRVAPTPVSSLKCENSREMPNKATSCLMLLSLARLTAGRLACQASSSCFAGDNESFGFLQLQSRGSAKESQPSQAPAPGYTVFEDFEMYTSPGQWPPSNVTVIDASSAGTVVFDGTNRFLTGASTPVSGIIFDSPVTSKVGTTLQAWLRFPPTGQGDGPINIGFDSNSDSAKYLQVNRRQREVRGPYVIEVRFGEALLGEVTSFYGVSDFEGPWHWAQDYQFFNADEEWIRVLITVLQGQIVWARIYDYFGDFRLAAWHNFWLGSSRNNEELDSSLFGSTISQSGTSSVWLDGDRQVDELATCQAPIPASRVSTDQGQCSHSFAFDDICIPSLSYTCTPSTLPLGTSTVECVGKDRNSSTSSRFRGARSRGPDNVYNFEITVVDPQPPVFDTLPNVTVNAGCQGIKQVFFEATATDDCSTEITCTPASGSLFPVGNTTVECTATDPSGNTATSSFRVGVAGDVGCNSSSPPWSPPCDSVPSLPDIPSIDAESPSCTTAQVSFDVSVVAGCGAESVCVPPSGSLFPLGITKVTCTASNEVGNDSMSFEVKVSCTRPRPRWRRRQLQSYADAS
ncbi:Hyalin [Symbiodinium sp. CCMP2592]|nr:Hyalin [Symbiodinium sp. CCMP2592]